MKKLKLIVDSPIDLYTGLFALVLNTIDDLRMYKVQPDFHTDKLI